MKPIRLCHRMLQYLAYASVLAAATMGRAALVNGGFEAGTTAGWSVFNPDGRPLGWGVTNDPAHVRSGSYAGALTSFGGTDSVVILHNDLDVSSWPTGSVCLGRLHVKTDALELATPAGEVRVIVVVRDAARAIIGYFDHNAGFRGTRAYTPVDTLFELPAGAVQAQIQLVCNSGIIAGAAFVDDASIERVQASASPLNGDFEAGSAAGWQIYNPDRQTVEWGVTNDPAHVHSGAFAGALTGFGGTNSPLFLDAKVDVSGWPPQSLCRARLSVKTVDLDLANPRLPFRIAIVVRDAGGNVIGFASQNGDFLGSNEYLPVELLFALPPGARLVSVSPRLESGMVSGAIYFDDVKVERVSPGELSMDIPFAAVQRDAGGTPRLHIDGHARVPSFYFGNSGHPVIYDEIRLAPAAGLDLISIPVDLPWRGTGTAMIEQALRANPDALFLPRVALYPPTWWLEQHPDLAMVDENGAPAPYDGGPSLASDEFIAACKEQLEILIRQLHGSPYRSHIIGYHLTYLNTQEWFYPEIAHHFWDYSEINRQRFVEWLQSRYPDVAALNSAWNKNYPSFDAVAVPAPAEWQSGNDGVFRDPARQRAVPDYAEYHNHLVADRISELAAHLKALTSGKSLVAAFYGYLSHLIINGGDRGIAHSGHLALKRLLASPDIDILCSPVAYYQREVGEPCDMMSVVDTVTAAGKLYLQEEDSNTYLITPTPPYEWNPWYSTEWDTMQCLRRNYGNVVGHNQAMWWMDIAADGRYNSEAVWTNNALLMSTAADVLANEAAFEPQVAVLFDEESFFWLRADSNHLTNPNVLELRSLFQSMGGAVGYYLVEDLPRIPESAKLLVFANTHRLDADERALIEETRSGGRTFLWLYAPGYVGDESLSVDHMQSATGFAFARNGGSADPAVRVAAGVASPIASGLANHVFGSQGALSPTFHVNPVPADAEVLGRYTGTNQPAFVAEDHGDWKSVFCGAPKPSLPVLRNVARYAGVNLVCDADTLDASNAVNLIGDYLYVYAMNNAGRRTFQLPGEKVPNGGFEKFTGALPTSGFGRWISAHSGSLATCSVIDTIAASGRDACATGPFAATAGAYAEPLGIALQGERGRTYRVSCSVYGEGLNATAASSGDFVRIAVQTRDGASALWSGSLAEGGQILLADRQWTPLEGAFTFPGGAGPSDNEMQFVLQISGAYAAANLLVDKVSVREEGCEPVDVFDVTAGAEVARGVTSWAADFALNEQKIFRLTPAPVAAGSFRITEVRFVDPGVLEIEWESLGDGYGYTVQLSQTPSGGWQPAGDPAQWPIVETHASIPLNGATGFFRVAAERLGP